MRSGLMLPDVGAHFMRSQMAVSWRSVTGSSVKVFALRASRNSSSCAAGSSGMSSMGIMR